MKIRNLMRNKIRNSMRNLKLCVTPKPAPGRTRKSKQNFARPASRAARTGAIVFAAALMLSGLLTACGKASALGQAQAAAPAAASAQSGTDTPQEANEKNLRIVTQFGEMPRDTQDGFYTVESPAFGANRNIMFFDYNTHTQRYLCSVENCKHDNAQCTSFVSGYGAIVPFVAGGKLYLNYYGYPEEQKPMEEWTSALVRRDLDGTNPQVVAQVDQFCAFDFVGTQYTDGEALYTLGLWDGVNSVRVDFATGEVTRRPWDASNNLLAVWGRKFISVRTEQGDESVQAFSKEIKLVATDADTGESTVLHTFKKNTYAQFGARVKNDKLYYVNPQTRVVMAYDFAADTETVVTDAMAQYGAPVERDYAAEGLGEEDAAVMQKERPIEYPANAWYAKLCGDWMIATVGNYNEMPHLMAYNLQTQALHEITFTDYWNGSEHNMNVSALTPHGFLVTEETRYLTQMMPGGRDGKPVSQECSYPVYALISEEDLLASTPNFATIQPVQYGTDSAVVGTA